MRLPYDGRVYIESGTSGDAFGADDPLSARITTKLLRCYRGMLCPQLGVETETEYILSDVSIVQRWNFKTPKPVANMQEELMANDQKLRILYCAGFYDVLTPIGYLRYLLSHFNFPEEE